MANMLQFRHLSMQGHITIIIRDPIPLSSWQYRFILVDIGNTIIIRIINIIIIIISA